MTSVSMVRLGDLLISAEYGSSKKADADRIGVPVLRMGNVTYEGALDTENLKFLPHEEVDAPKELLRFGDILFNRTNSRELVGKAAMWDGRFDAIAASYFIRVRVDESRVLPAYVAYWLNSPTMKRRFVRSARGAIGQANINAKELRAYLLPLPNLQRQQQVVSILDSTVRLLGLRTRMAANARELMPASFEDMFGDPARNPMDWPLTRLGDLAARFSDGPFGSNLKSSHYTPEGVRVWRLQNIGIGELLDDDRAYISDEHFTTLRKHECRPGDVIIGTLGEPNLRAMIQPADVPIALNKADCVQMRVDGARALASWACWLLNMPGTLDLARSKITGQTRQRISMGQLRELSVPTPPLTEQCKFDRRLSIMLRLRDKADVALQEARQLRLCLLDDFFGDHSQ